MPATEPASKPAPTSTSTTSAPTTSTSSTTAPTSTGPTNRNPGYLSYVGAPNAPVFLGEVADGNQNDPYPLEVVDQPQGWTLDNGHLISYTGRALYDQSSNIVTYAISSAPAGAVIYQCTQDATSDPQNVVLDCNANGQTLIVACSNKRLYDNGDACANADGDSYTTSRQFLLEYGIQK